MAAPASGRGSRKLHEGTAKDRKGSCRAALSTTAEPGKDRSTFPNLLCAKPLGVAHCPTAKTISEEYKRSSWVQAVECKRPESTLAESALGLVKCFKCMWLLRTETERRNKKGGWKIKRQADRQTQRRRETRHAEIARWSVEETATLRNRDLDKQRNGKTQEG